MVCVNPKTANLITRSLRPTEQFRTQYGVLFARDWLERERDRMAAAGIACSLVVTPGGRLALLKND